MQLGVTTLGQQAVVLEGRPVRWSSRAASNLFYLLLAHPQGAARTTITEKLWGANTSEARNSFKVTMYRLRQALGDPGATVEQEGRYALAPVYYQHADHIRFQDALRQARSAETREERLRHTYQALSLYAGDFLPDVPDDWAEETRSTLRAAYVRARTQAATLHCEALECQSAIRNLASGLGADPLVGEGLHRNLMTCLCSLGRADDAVSHYRHFLTFIQRDVGDTPTQATVDLADHIRNGTPHAAQAIGAARPCPRRLLYGVPSFSEATPRHLDLTPWETEVQRGKQMLSLLHKLRSVHGWQALVRQVQGFLGTHLGAPYVWLVPHRPAQPPAPAWAQDLGDTGWPAPVIAAFRTALAGTGAQAASPGGGNDLALGVTVHLISDHQRRPHAWLSVARPEGAPALSSSDAELLARVVDVLGYVLSQARWAAL